MEGVPAAVTVDGSLGEGGGQILRTSLALSVLLGTELTLPEISQTIIPYTTVPSGLGWANLNSTPNASATRSAAARATGLPTTTARNSERRDHNFTDGRRRYFQRHQHA